MFLCVTIDNCKNSTGYDGLKRVISLDGYSCIDRTTCTNENITVGYVLNGTCVCSSTGAMPYFFNGTQSICLTALYFPYTTQTKCPGNYYMNLSGQCNICPSTGCYSVINGTNTSVNSKTYCGENT